MINIEDYDKIVSASDLLTSFLLENTEEGFEVIDEVDRARTLLLEIRESYNVSDINHLNCDAGLLDMLW